MGNIRSRVPQPLALCPQASHLSLGHDFTICHRGLGGGIGCSPRTEQTWRTCRLVTWWGAGQGPLMSSLLPGLGPGAPLQEGKGHLSWGA